MGVTVGDVVTQLFGDTALWQAVDGAISSLIINVLGDSEVQDALTAEVSSAVI